MPVRRINHSAEKQVTAMIALTCSDSPFARQGIKAWMKAGTVETLRGQMPDSWKRRICNLQASQFNCCDLQPWPDTQPRRGAPWPLAELGQAELEATQRQRACNYAYNTC